MKVLKPVTINLITKGGIPTIEDIQRRTNIVRTDIYFGQAAIDGYWRYTFPAGLNYELDKMFVKAYRRTTNSTNTVNSSIILEYTTEEIIVYPVVRAAETNTGFNLATPVWERAVNSDNPWFQPYIAVEVHILADNVIT